MRFLLCMYLNNHMNEEIDTSYVFNESREKAREIRALTVLLAEGLVLEDISDDDLSYYTRKLQELKTVIKDAVKRKIIN